MTTRRTEKTDVTDCVEVWFEDRRYFVRLNPEWVGTEVSVRGKKPTIRRVTSFRIETACLLRASDKVNDTIPGERHFNI